MEHFVKQSYFKISLVPIFKGIVWVTQWLLMCPLCLGCGHPVSLTQVTTRKGLCGSDGKESACNAGDPGSIPGSERWVLPGGGHGNPLQYSCLEDPHGRRSLAGYSPWGRKSRTWLSYLAQHSKGLYVSPLLPFHCLPVSDSSIFLSLRPSDHPSSSSSLSRLRVRPPLLSLPYFCLSVWLQLCFL